ncbi:MAG: hypothetical protein UZ21_OP11001000243 [Microgenomates bacterium OLB22]|nr:MAG: hypothetical protein UZ21_OP11001000243 [Microgenomates bacterium OLB22]
MQKVAHKKLSDTLLTIITQNPYVHEIIQSDPFPEIRDWYLAAGCITQSVWNHLSGRPITEGIEDYDLIYFDPDLSKDREAQCRERIGRLFSHLPIHIDVVNEARVHEWFHEYFFRTIRPYTSCEDAISSWSPCSAVGVTCKKGKIGICAPLGLEDLFFFYDAPT